MNEIFFFLRFSMALKINLKRYLRFKENEKNEKRLDLWIWSQ